MRTPPAERRLSSAEHDVVRAVAELLEAGFGHSCPPTKFVDLRRSLEGRAVELGYDTLEGYGRALLEAKSGPLVDALITALTVGETYLFRHTAAFDALRQVVLPRLIEANSSTKTLRIWSAGCSTGEETYSLAIAVKEVLGTKIGWRVTVRGTDIDREALDAARRGAYREWSFRETPAHIRTRYFTPNGDRWEIAEDIRPLVSFEYHNLVTDPSPTLMNGTYGMDLIVCRNVTIYFSDAAKHKVAAMLGRALSPYGWLLVGSSEPNASLYLPLQAQLLNGVTFYRPVQEGDRSPRSAEPQVRPSRPISAKTPIPARSMERTREASRTEPHPAPGPERGIPKGPAHVAPPAPVETKGEDLTGARRAAGYGHLEEALSLAEAAVERAPLDPQAHYVLGLIESETGRRSRAIGSLKRSLYLDSGNGLAYFVLGGLFRAAGDEAEARRAWRNAASCLHTLHPDVEIPGGEGLAAGRLLEIVQANLDERGADV